MANEQARLLRRNQTEAEKRLWRELRQLKATGSHFRRQAPMGIYVVDFVCHTARLIVEVDGGQHGRDEVIVRDQQRTEWLEKEGYNVIRFWNNDVMKNMDGVMQIIAQHLAYNTD